MTIKVAALLTVHDRKEKTLSSLKRFYEQEDLPKNFETCVVVVDDHSTDGTSEAIRNTFPQVRIIQGSGSLYWNGGMHLAFCEAYKEDFDFYLWLNDDTELFSHALSQLLKTYNNLGEMAIVVGSTQDPNSKKLTYGGIRRLSRRKPLKFSLVEPDKFAFHVKKHRKINPINLSLIQFQ
jgi:GT2 family glycosyltransferase